MSTKYTFQPHLSNGGGLLGFMTTDLRTAVDYYGRHVARNLNPVDIMEAVGEVSLNHPFAHHRGTDKRPFFLVEGEVGQQFLEPYFKRFSRFTGMPEDTAFPEMEVKNPKDSGITHVVESYSLCGQRVHFKICIQAEDHCGRPAEVRAESNAQEYANLDFGDRPRTPEFIMKGNNAYYPNPEYGKHQYPVPAAKAKWFWDALIQYWLEHHATPGQLEIIEQEKALAGHSKWFRPCYDIADNCSQTIYVLSTEEEGGFDYDGKRTFAKHLSWEQFREA